MKWRDSSICCADLPMKEILNRCKSRNYFCSNWLYPSFISCPPGGVTFFAGSKKVTKKRAFTQKIAPPPATLSIRTNPLHPRSIPTQATDFFPAARTPRYPHPPFLRPTHRFVALTRSAFIFAFNSCYFITMPIFSGGIPKESEVERFFNLLRRFQNDGQAR